MQRCGTLYDLTDDLRPHSLSSYPPQSSSSTHCAPQDLPSTVQWLSSPTPTPSAAMARYAEEEEFEDEEVRPLRRERRAMGVGVVHQPPAAEPSISPQEELEEEEEDLFAPAARAGAAPRAAVNNAEGLASVLEDFAWPSTLAWVDTLVVRVRHSPLPRAPPQSTFVRSIRGFAIAAACPGRMCNMSTCTRVHSLAARPRCRWPRLRAYTSPVHAPDTARCAFAGRRGAGR